MKQECSYYTKQQHNHKHHVLPVEYRSMTLQDTKGEVQPVYVDTLGCVTEMHYVFSTQTYLQLIFGKCTQGFLCLIANLPYLRRGISCREKKYLNLMFVWPTAPKIALHGNKTFGWLDICPVPTVDYVQCGVGSDWQATLRGQQN